MLTLPEISVDEKRPISIDKLEAIVNEIESSLQNSMEREVTSVTIGKLAMDSLRNLDEVAYVRFASVYRDFKDIDSFVEELDNMKKSK